MAERNWGRITDGTTFEGLVTTLVFFEHPKAALFGRRGKDGGQDVRDGARVFQAKHHEGGSAAKAIADAKKEAAKIERYQQSDHERYSQWQGVTDWRLVTNAAFNPTDHQTWMVEVVPLFAKLRLKIDYWERATLNALLDRHPYVSQAYFEDEPRAFYSLQEVRDRLVQEEPFLARSAQSPFQGRQGELARLGQFVSSDKLFLVVHGAGGIGKTRLLVEGGEGLAQAGWQVLWANVATIAAGASWFDAIVPERPTVVLVDEPDDEQVLRVLAEQLGGRVGRTAKWKVLVSVRSPKDPVLRFLFGARLHARTEKLLVEALPQDAAAALCEELLAGGVLADREASWRKEVSEDLAARFGRHPVWLTLAVHLLEVHGTVDRIPDSAAGLANQYLAEIVERQAGDEPDQIRSLLRWVALLRTVNRESDASLRLIGDGSGVGEPSAVLAMIARLVQRRALTERGANSRLVELKPDVLRDHVLREWLVVNVGFGAVALRPSDHVVGLLGNCTDAIAQGGLSPIGTAILTSVARTELLFRLEEQPVPLLDPFFESLRGSIPTLSVTRRLALAEVLVEVAPFRPRDVAATVGALRTTVVPDETIETVFGTRLKKYDEVLLDLAWPLYHAAMGAQSLDERLDILGELLALVRVEAEISQRRGGQLPNDGRRAFALVGRTLEGGPHFWSSFDDAVGRLALVELERLSSGAPTAEQVEAFRSLAIPAVTVERQQTWSEQDSFVFRKYVITEEHPGWSIRSQILDRTRALLADETVPAESHLVLWGLLVEAHRQANYVALNGPPEYQARLRERFLEELAWAHDVLGKRKAGIEEMKAARDLWDWHVRFEEDVEIKSAAIRLEQLYVANDLAGEFEPFMEFDSIEGVQKRAEEKAAALATAGDGAIEAFIERSIRFTGSDDRFSAVLGVASELGALADATASVRTFVTNTLRAPMGTKHAEFALAIASRWFDVRRRTSGDVLGLANALMAASADDSTRIDVLIALYGMTPPKLRGQKVGNDELAFIRSHADLFRRQARSAAFVGLVSWTLEHEWPAYKQLIEAELRQLKEPELTRAVASLIQGVFWTVYERSKSEFPDDLNVWLLEQLILIPNFDKLGSNLEWRLGSIIKTLGRVSSSWMAKALKVRAAMEAETPGVRAVNYDSALGDYVEPVGQAQPGDPQVTALVGELLDLVDDPGSVGYRLPDILHKIDPHGHVVATQAAERVRRSGADQLPKLARLAQSYVVNTPGWRVIAKAVLAVATTLPTDDERKSLYRKLGDPGIRSWNGRPGEVPPIFVSAVETARRYQGSEEDAAFGPFWRWYVAGAEAELRHQEEVAKEDRGE